MPHRDRSVVNQGAHEFLIQKYHVWTRLGTPGRRNEPVSRSPRMVTSCLLSAALVRPRRIGCREDSVRTIAPSRPWPTPPGDPTAESYTL